MMGVNIFSSHRSRGRCSTSGCESLLVAVELQDYHMYHRSSMILFHVGRKEKRKTLLIVGFIALMLSSLKRASTCAR